MKSPTPGENLITAIEHRYQLLCRVIASSPDRKNLAVMMHPESIRILSQEAFLKLCPHSIQQRPQLNGFTLVESTAIQPDDVFICLPVFKPLT